MLIFDKIRDIQLTSLESVQDPIYDKKLNQVSADLKQYRLNQLRKDGTNKLNLTS